MLSPLVGCDDLDDLDNIYACTKQNSNDLSMGTQNLSRSHIHITLHNNTFTH